MDGREIGLEFVVGIGDEACDLRQYVGLAPAERPGIDASYVVIIGMEILPDHRLALEHAREVLERLRRDFFRDDLGPRPENLDAGRQPLPDFPEISRLADIAARHAAAIFGRAEEQPAVRP